MGDLNLLVDDLEAGPDGWIADELDWLENVWLPRVAEFERLFPDDSKNGS